MFNEKSNKSGEEFSCLERDIFHGSTVKLTYLNWAPENCFIKKEVSRLSWSFLIDPPVSAFHLREIRVKAKLRGKDVIDAIEKRLTGMPP